MEDTPEYEPKWSVEQLGGKLKKAQEAVDKIHRGIEKMNRKMCPEPDEETEELTGEFWDRYVKAWERFFDASEALWEIETEVRRMRDWAENRVRETETEFRKEELVYRKAAKNLDRAAKVLRDLHDLR